MQLLGGRTLNIILCEPYSTGHDQLRQLISEWGKQFQHENEIIVIDYDSSEDLYTAWEKGLLIDILFIESNISYDLSGFEIAHRIQLINRNIPIVVIADKDFINFEQYHSETLRFLFRPITFEHFFSCMNACWIQALDNKQDTIVLKDRNQVIFISASAITFIEHAHRHTEVHVVDREEAYLINSTLQQVYMSLPEKRFLRCHKSFIVNKQYIAKIQNGQITISPDFLIPIGRKYQSSFMEKVMEKSNEQKEKLV